MRKIILLMLSVLAASGCEDNKVEQPTTTTSTTTDQQQYDTTYIVGVETSHTPYALRNEQGLPTGYDIDIIKAIADQEHFNVRFIPTDWNGIFDRLNDGTRDMVASGVSITPGRRDLMDFSTPINQYQFSLMAKDGTPYQQLEDLNGQKIAIVGGTSLSKMARDKVQNIDFELQEYPSTFLAFRSVINDETAAVFDHGGALAYYAKSFPASYFDGGFHFITIPDNPVVSTGIAVRKGNSELLSKLNSGIQKIKANGTFEQITNKWYGNE